MAKQKKKRNKVYSGSVAATRPAVTHISAVNRSRSGQWWHDHKRFVRPIGMVALVVFAVILVISGIVGIFTNL